MITEDQLKTFVNCGLAAQKAVDKIIREHNKEEQLNQAAQKAATTGNLRDLSAYLKLRRELQ